MLLTEINKTNRKLMLVLILLSIVIFFEASILKVLPFIYTVLFCFIILLFLCIKEKNSFSMPFIFLYFTSIAFFCSTFYSNFPVVSFTYSMQFLIMIGVSYCLYIIKGWRGILVSLFLSMAFVVALSVYLSYLFPEIYIRFVLTRFSVVNEIFVENLINSKFHPGIYINTGYTAFFLSIGLSIIFSKQLYNKKRVNLLGILMLVFLVIPILLTGKRSFLVSNLSSMLSLIYIFLLQTKNKFGIRMFRIIIISILVYVFIYLFIPSVISDFFSRLGWGSGSFDLRDLSQGRYDLFNYGISIFMEAPFLGMGIETAPYEFVKNNFTSTIIGVHDIYIKLLSEVGIVGTFLFLITVLLSLYRTVKLYFYCMQSSLPYSIHAAVSLYIQILFLVYGIFGNPLSDLNMLLTYFIAISISENIYRSELIFLGGEKFEKKREVQSRYN